MNKIWWLPLALHIIVAYCLYPIAIKKVAKQHSFHKKFMLTFLFCATIATTTLLLFPENFRIISGKMLALMAVGFANAFAAFCKWRAMGINLSRNSLATIVDDVIAITLSYFFLNESRFLTPFLGTGVLLSLSAIGMITYRDFRRKEEGDNKIPAIFYLYVITYSLIWGMAIFFLNYLAVDKIPLSHFMFGWYGGAFIGALLIFVLHSIKAKRQAIKFRVDIPTNVPFSKKDIALLFLIATMTTTALGLQYLALWLSPQIVVQPIVLSAEAILPTLIGLFLFNERKGLKLLDWLCLLVGVIGAIMVSISKI